MLKSPKAWTHSPVHIHWCLRGMSFASCAGAPCVTVWPVSTSNCVNNYTNERLKIKSASWYFPVSPAGPCTAVHRHRRLKPTSRSNNIVIPTQPQPCETWAHVSMPRPSSSIHVDLDWDIPPENTLCYTGLSGAQCCHGALDTADMHVIAAVRSDNAVSFLKAYS